MQEWNRTKREIDPSDIVWTPAGVRHWHGATATIAISHYANQEAVDGKNVDWLEKVSDEQFADWRSLGWR